MRRVGWRNEPRRHSLAAHGISSVPDEYAMVAIERQELVDVVVDDDVGLVPTTEVIDTEDYRVEELEGGEDVVEEGDVLEIEQEDGGVLEYSIVDGVAMPTDEANKLRTKKIREQMDAITRRPAEKRPKPAKMNLFEVMAKTREEADQLERVGKAMRRQGASKTKAKMSVLNGEAMKARQNLEQIWSGVDRSDSELGVAYRDSKRRIEGELRVKALAIRSKAQEMRIEAKRYREMAKDYRRTANNLKAFITYREEQSRMGRFND